MIRSQLGLFINRFRKENWAELMIHPKPSCYEGSVHRFNGSKLELSLQKIELHIFLTELILCEPKYTKLLLLTELGLLKNKNQTK